ncbi:MAG TPA: hypothetical protein VGG73_08600 [Vicinamibacterales bacterium]|jgi:hypothetical protein
MRPSYLVATLLTATLALTAWTAVPAAQTDLDAFMRDVLARRDDNWKKLQQYVLDEREEIDLRGPGHVPIWGERREYTWYIRDGFFVRSPLKFNGVQISEPDRRKFEADYLRRVQARDKRGGRGQASDLELAAADTPRDLDGLIRQSREPQFISSAYFLRFKFEEGKYALVGHETVDGRDTLRIEYYPAKMFGGTDRRHSAEGPTTADKARDAEFQRLMNKVSLVTLWVEPTAHQIIKYTFDNVALDFLPAQWLVQINDVKASMTMTQAFPDVWLPSGLNVSLALTLAVGEFDMRYGLEYHDYRQPDVTSKVGVK